ncbi:MAG TPA: hypothetical protein PJ991_03920 [Kiritimatiellia bacterium]|nr:hypothetical protein [Kiritimatiellia bacterium]
MKTEKELDQLADKFLRTASRNMDIPPTPRDTLAVLRQAAEKSREASNTNWFVFGRWIATAAIILAIASGILFLQSPRQNMADSENIISGAMDIGIDLAEWDMEIESLMVEINDSIASMSDSAFEGIDSNNDWILNGNGELWL